MAHWIVRVGAVEVLVQLLVIPEADGDGDGVPPSREARQHALHALKFLGLENQAKLTLVEAGGEFGGEGTTSVCV